jgi:uncharacterized repeat protein (TIGR01451 family)
MRVLITLALLVLAVTPVGAAPSRQTAENPDRLTAVDLIPTGSPAASKIVGAGKGDAAGRYIVQLQAAPLAVYAGNRLAVDAPAAEAYWGRLKAEQAQLAEAISAALSRPVRPVREYRLAFNGFVVELAAGEAVRVAKLPGVARLYADQLNQPVTDAGPTWIGANSVWNNTVTSLKTQGEGVLVGILDTGINSDHPSFASPGPVDGYVYVNPFGSGNFLGACDPTNVEQYDPSFQCNDKLVGAYSFLTVTESVTPEDANGHGSHTASTVAGNRVNADGNILSGVAPHANIIAFDVCDNVSGCWSSDAIQAVDQAIDDGVDVINYSISGGDDPYNDPVEQAFLNATAFGMVVVTSAGNAGPFAETVAHRSPWVLSVAATTHNRAYLNSLTSMVGGATTPPANMVGRGMTGSLGLTPIVYAGNYGNPYCNPSGSWINPAGLSGKIVVCDRGNSIARTDKAVAVRDRGAVGFVLANDIDNGYSLVSDAYVIPGVMISYAHGQQLKSWLASGSNHRAAISGMSVSTDPANGDLLAGFSSRGPNTTFDVLKPDLAAPGVDIVAAVHTPDPAHPGAPEFGSLSGTSMASPHAAGAVALLKALHPYPAWSPAEIRSALMLTAKTAGMFKEDAVTPLNPQEMGSGRIQVDLASRVGFVMDETIDRFSDADPQVNLVEIPDLNLPSLYSSQCVGGCTWTRTIRNVTGADIEYTTETSASAGMNLTVQPATFTLDSGATQQILVRADVSGVAVGEWGYGEVRFLTDDLLADDQLISDAHFTVAALSSPANLPAEFTLVANRDQGSTQLNGLQAAAITQMALNVQGISAPTLVNTQLSEDETGFAPYDNLDEVYYTILTVPPGALRLVAQVLDTQSFDLDFYWGIDTNENNLPDEDEQIGSVETFSPFEYLSLLNPDPGDYWLLVQNYQGRYASDTLLLATAVISADAGNTVASGPPSVLAGTDFSLRFDYNIDAPIGSLWYGAVSIGADTGHPGNIGTIGLNFRREADDVVKTVSVSAADPGDTVRYTIAVGPNLSNSAISYSLTDTLPIGLELVPSSFQITGSTTPVNYNPDTRRITWNGSLPAFTAPTYTVSTNQSDPNCRTPYGNGGYYDLATQGFHPEPGVSGDMLAFQAFQTGNTFEFYGKHYRGLYLTDDGFIGFNLEQWIEAPVAWINQAIPDTDDPNTLIAPFWKDLEIVYDAATNRGVTAVAAGADTVIIEYDDVENFRYDPSGVLYTYDFEIILQRQPSDQPGRYEIFFAYDHINGPVDDVTVGVENENGTAATAVLPTTIQNGRVICFDRAQAQPDTVTISFDAVIQPGATWPVVNSVQHDNNLPNTRNEWASATVYRLQRNFLPFLRRN